MRILAIRIPNILTRMLGLRQNSEVELDPEKGRVVLATAPSYTLDELLAGITPSNLHGEKDWGPAIGKEVW
jgi:antitoxin MazE